MNTAQWAGRRVLVTGARGFIATHLCHRLAQYGAQVTGVSRVALPASATMAWSRADLGDPAAVRALLEAVAPDVVFHLAGHVTGSQQVAEIQPTLQTNLVSTVHLLTAAVEVGGCRVVVAGSMQEPHAMDPEAVPCSPYAASKWACTAYARLFHALYQLPVIIARPFMVYGPGQWDLTKLLPYAITSLLRNKPIRVSSGDRVLDWIYVDDVVTAFVTLADIQEPYATAIDLGSGELVSVREILQRVAGLIGGADRIEFGAIPDRPLERPHAARVDDTHCLTGWSPSTPLDVGLAKSVAWYRAHLDDLGA